MVTSVTTGSDFGGLARYLADDEGRVAFIGGDNLLREDPEWAVVQMRDTAAMSDRVEKPVYHLSITFPPEDETTRDERLWATREVLRELGIEDHEALYVEHSDTKHDHVHAMVNRVHPSEGTAWTGAHDYQQIETAERRIEQEMGWREVPGYHARPFGTDKPSPALRSWEAERQQDNGRVPFRQVVREIGGNAFAEAESWADLERRLTSHGLRLAATPRGGLVTDDHEMAKLSGVDPDWSTPRLTERFGQSLQQYIQKPDSRPRPSDISTREAWSSWTDEIHDTAESIRRLLDENKWRRPARKHLSYDAGEREALERILSPHVAERVRQAASDHREEIITIIEVEENLCEEALHAWEEAKAHHEKAQKAVSGGLSDDEVPQRFKDNPYQLSDHYMGEAAAAWNRVLDTASPKTLPSSTQDTLLYGWFCQHNGEIIEKKARRKREQSGESRPGESRHSGSGQSSQDSSHDRGRGRGWGRR